MKTLIDFMREKTVYKVVYREDHALVFLLTDGSQVAIKAKDDDLLVRGTRDGKVKVDERYAVIK